jgi:multisubunit Na+/H+ antiporter MnhG subunit
MESTSLYYNQTMNTLPTRYERQAAEYKKKTIAAACQGLGATGAMVFFEMLFTIPIPTFVLWIITTMIFYYLGRASYYFTVYRQALKLKNRYSTWPPIFTP